MTKYAEFMRNQVTELLTNYGDIDVLWFDFSYTPQSQSWQAVYKPWMQFGGGKGKEQWESEELIKTARSLQPDIIIDNRAQFLHDGSEILYTENEMFRMGEHSEPNQGSVYFKLPAVKPDIIVPVIEVILK